MHYLQTGDIISNGNTRKELHSSSQMSASDTFFLFFKLSSVFIVCILEKLPQDALKIWFCTLKYI